MKSEIQWLVYLGRQRNLFPLPPCRELARELGPETEIVAFAEELLKRDLCTDFDALQSLVEEAYDRSLHAGPPENPFDESAAPVESDDAAVKPHLHDPIEELSKELPPLEHLNALKDTESAREPMRELLRICERMGASDLHLSSQARPFVRLNRKVRFLYDGNLREEAGRLLNTALISRELAKEFDTAQDLDFALTIGDRQRYRANLFVHKDGISGTYRIVPDKVPALEELGFEDLTQIRKLLSYNNGLILVTGPVGSGKTVTLAAMMDELNRTRNDHLIAVEEPIEIVQRSQHCHITQREVGLHTSTFSSALKGALRQDPDIIVIGEMRDLETIEMAISASETGHLVIGTLHTNDAANTLNRVLDVFPAAQQTQIRVMLSHALRGIICQNLIPSAKGGMTLAYELLISNTAVRSLIHDNKPEGLVNVMETGSSEGMQLMDKSILTLWEKDEITDEVALKSLRSKIKRHQLAELIKLQQPTE
ncbi:MAG: type IV pilus twitching motility protein PilT [Verrucomicrobiota bacterium]